ncbi:MAG TPA: hypothetical protein VFQ60_01200 [Patescibacteria group bacterium]|nr:hypothetical protein [Patescibacteria group bacterium]
MENQTRVFNVLCVTKRHRDEREPIHWHVPITGHAVLITSFEEEFGVKIAMTRVRFQNEEHELLYVRPGLDGTAVTLGIAVSDFPYDVWELYTDTPTGETSAEKIREIAQHAVAYSSRW